MPGFPPDAVGASACSLIDRTALITDPPLSAGHWPRRAYQVTPIGSAYTWCFDANGSGTLRFRAGAKLLQKRDNARPAGAALQGCQFPKTTLRRVCCAAARTVFARIGAHSFSAGLESPAGARTLQ